MIHFLLNDTAVKVEKYAPHLTVLDWIRTTTGKMGTKEGCATGDCGACTLLVGEQVMSKDGQTSWQYKAMNSCLLMLGNVHGKHVVTVEAVTPLLQPGLDDLHPVQRAMVECHGSQCGFCTPGIVMSLMALYMNHATYPGRKTVIEALGGNLCRCTGYNPILAAAEKAFEYPRVENTWANSAAQFKQNLSNHQTPFLQHQAHRFYVPQTIDALLALKDQYPHAQLVAGATDLAIEYSQHLLAPEIIISVTQAKGLSSFVETEQVFEIGAALPYSQFVAQFCAEYPEASELFERLGATQVRNAGTLGGSLGNASPIGDPAPLLIALNAIIELQSADCVRTLPVEDFFEGYRQTVLKANEVITRVIIPKRSESLLLACHKVSKRFEDDISTVCLVLALTHGQDGITSARCALGGMAAIPARSPHVEQAFINKTLLPDTFDAAAAGFTADFAPLSDVRASADYRITVCQNLMKRIGFELASEHQDRKIASDTPLRIAHASL